MAHIIADLNQRGINTLPVENLQIPVEKPLKVKQMN
jgi:hypothetical protein